jgi:cyclase
MEIDKMGDDLYVCIGDAYDSNSTILLHGTAALLIDSMASRKDALELKEFIESQLRKSVRFIICTHYFSDHIAGLKVFPMAYYLAHENYLETFDSEKHRSKEEASFFVKPSLLITSGLRIPWGRFNLDVFYNPGHTMSTLNVDVPEADLIHVGDTLVGNMVYFMYSYPDAFFSAFNKIKERGRSKLLSSHSGIRTAAAVDSAIHYLQSLYVKSVKEWRNGSEQNILDFSLDDCLPVGIRGTPFENIFHKRNLKTILERKFFAPQGKENQATSLPHGL